MRAAAAAAGFGSARMPSRYDGRAGHWWVWPLGVGCCDKRTRVAEAASRAMKSVIEAAGIEGWRTYVWYHVD